MSSSPEEFEQLKKALKIKNYEQPPPGYFNEFSSRVVRRIEREQSRSKSANWLSNFIRILETNAFAAGGFGFSVCGLLIAGIAYSEYKEPSESTSSAVTVADMNSGMGSKKELGTFAAAANNESLAPSMDLAMSTNFSSSSFSGDPSSDLRQISYSDH